jgi:hypothetical protein
MFAIREIIAKVGRVMSRRATSLVALTGFLIVAAGGEHV